MLRKKTMIKGINVPQSSQVLENFYSSLRDVIQVIQSNINHEKFKSAKFNLKIKKLKKKGIKGKRSQEKSPLCLSWKGKIITSKMEFCINKNEQENNDDKCQTDSKINNDNQLQAEPATVDQAHAWNQIVCASYMEFVKFIIQYSESILISLFLFAQPTQL